MRKIVLGLAIAALASAGPAWAGDKKQSKSKEESGSASMQKNGAEGRGGLSEWPVSKSPPIGAALLLPLPQAADPAEARDQVRTVVPTAR